MKSISRVSRAVGMLRSPAYSILRARVTRAFSAAASGTGSRDSSLRQKLDDGLGLEDFVKAGTAGLGNQEPEGIAADRQERAVMPLFDLPADIKDVPFKTYTKRHIKKILAEHAPQLDYMDYYVPSTVLPMRTNNYLVDELIDWSNVPNDPMFRLVFPQPDMLSEEHSAMMRGLIESGEAKGVKLQTEANKIRALLNPHPAGQKTLNVPKVDGEEVPGLQHKYRETVLFFPTESQYCQAYCTYCFRFAQFVAVGSSLQFASKDAQQLARYLEVNKGVSDLLFTGGDPGTLTAEQFSRYIDPLLNTKEHEHVQTIRIGTKSLAYWPYRYVTDSDADDFLRLIKRVVDSGKHVSFMAHFTHPVELSTPVVKEAMRRIRSTGAQIRTQAPLVKHINDDADTWATMWREQVRLGAVPYYMFVERDTGPRAYFEVPLEQGYDIFTKAFTQQSGLARTVRGPSMSCEPGKVHYLGPATIKGEKVMMFKFLQARNPEWSKQPFFAQYDSKAVWLHDLKPAFGEKKFFFEDELKAIEQAGASSGQLLQADE